MKCLARQYSDQMMCAECGLAWDVNDPDPPSCRTAAERARDAVKAMGLDVSTPTPEPELRVIDTCPAAEGFNLMVRSNVRIPEGTKLRVVTSKERNR